MYKVQANHIFLKKSFPKVFLTQGFKRSLTRGSGNSLTQGSEKFLSQWSKKSLTQRSKRSIIGNLKSVGKSDKC